MGIRSFLAFEIPLEIREKIETIAKELKNLSLPVRWVRPENIHLTIVFLGSVDQETIDSIKQRAQMVVNGFSTFKIRLNCIGVFPNWRKPRVIWVGLDGDVERLENLRNNLQEKLKSLGFLPEKRPFRAHITLGRFKGPFAGDDKLKWIIDKYHDINSNVNYLNELILFKSDLKPDGPVYAKMAVWPLKTG
ncbi:MAG TPA: RNA 2',3'-cyclic phosphodiesterase [Desulfatiglandales bacterium]|nr:RNA 2',3'-cyclic phosphodiesterase [Desulfatiglandales bacterium]